MKRFTSLVLLMVSLHTFAQFGPQNIVDTQGISISEIVTADVDNDSLQDIIVTKASNPTNVVTLYLNQGDTTFSAGQNLTTIQFPNSLATGDLDNNGWEDIVTMNGGFDVFVMMNNGGTFGPKTHIDSVVQPIDVKIDDIDLDNDLDIVIIGDYELDVLYNDGAGNFTEQNIMPGITTEYYDLFLSDLDNDGFKEVIAGGVQTLIYKNNAGTISFDSARTASIVNQGLIFLVIAEDFNGDGSNDILIAGDGSSDIRWYSNDGNGLFTFEQIIDQIQQCGSAISRDFDQDGDMDIFTVKHQQGEVIWYENPGNGVFSSASLIHQGSIAATQEVYSSDLNNDSKPDLIWSGELSFHINQSFTQIDESHGVDITVYPNPMTDFILVESSMSGTLNVFDVSGRCILQDIPIQSGTNHIDIQCPAGTYLLEIVTSNNRYASRLIKN